MTQPSIFFLANAFADDAPTRLLLEVAQAAKQKGCDVQFAALSREGELEREVRMHFPDARCFRAGGAGLFSATWQLFLHFVRWKPDIVHSALVRPAIIGTLTAARAGVPHIIITQHGIHEWEECGRLVSPFVPRLFRTASRKADVIITVSNANRERLLAAGIEQDKLRVIHNGVDTNRFSPALRSHREAILRGLFGEGDHGDVLLVGAAGMLKPVKAHDVLFAAAVDVWERIPDSRFVVWGEGECRQNLERWIAMEGLQDRFKLPGPARDVATAMAACDLFVQPSRWESFGLAVVEAMACGVPVIASNTGGMAETVVPGETGILVPLGSATELADAISDLLKNEPTRQAMRQRARTHVEANFSVKSMTDEHLELYQSMMDARG